MAEKVELYKETEFKDTEIGRIPEEWEVMVATDVADYINGYPFSPTDWKMYGIPIIRIQNLNDPNAEFNFFDGEIDDIYKIKNGDLLFSWSASIGIYIWKGGDAVLNQHIFKVVQKANINKLFLYYDLLLAIEQLKGRVHGSTMKHFQKNELKTTFMPIPPLSEQQKIAEILSTVDESIQKTDNIIAKTERLKKGLMQELLTKGIGHNEFKDTEIGRIPKEWKTSNLGEVSYLIMGQSPPSKTYNRDMIGLPFLQGRMDFGDMYPNPSVYCSKPIKIAEEGDVLVSVRAPVGDINIATSKLCIGRGLAAIRPDKNQLDAKFIFYQLKHFSARLVDLGSGSTFKAIRRNELERFPTVLPPLSEQQKIASILSTVDEKLETLKQEKVKLKRIKQWFMEELLTGRIRVRIA